MVATGAVRQAAYRLKMREVLESQPNLQIKQAEVAELIVEEASADSRQLQQTATTQRRQGQAND